MFQRTSCVDDIRVKIVSFASTVQLGDSCIINGLSRAIAVQREVEIEYGNEGNFSVYPVFTEPIPFQPITESLAYTPRNLNPIIKVNNIGIIGMSSASILHVGNSQHVSMETRIKHIRQLLPHEEEEQGQGK
ncbi:spore germination protein GerPE [Neobacillus ginsengisoli]|uniref:Spore germination protein PE n=1 Tax=Neobacillus ginsengisoli TaxID=904295 RepID=A0ABT9XS89_9BACI|nr:spore germination protein GerPE [Neobacillus ginsengisoli]MDQ0198135.1 spore germination protein PE [Neobacillus ginsengisoli]